MRAEREEAMNCSQCQDLLVEYSLGELEPREADEVAAHLAGGCTECERGIVKLQESLAMVGRSLNPVPVPPRVKQDLLARIRSERGRGEWASSDQERLPEDADPATLLFPVQPAKRRTLLSRTLPFAAAILVGFTVGALATKYFAGGSRNGADRETLLAAMIEEARKSLGSPDVRFAALHSPQNADEVLGHLMWDARGRSLHFFAFDVTLPAPGKALVVWFETSTGQMIRAGELELSERGASSEVFAAPKGGDEISAVVVTEESDESVTSPQGPPRILARFGATANGADSE
jgi:hypothetical protein